MATKSKSEIFFESAYIKSKEALEKIEIAEPKLNQIFLESKKTQKDNEKIQRDYKVIKKEIKNIQTKTIEILAIFVAIIGFLFGFLKFSTLPQFTFLEVVCLLLIFGIILYGFIYLIHLILGNNSPNS